MEEQMSKAGPPVNDISVLRFSSARAQEISSLTNLIENPKTTKLIFQKLPAHMRRRAMSHNPKRMPRALRRAHISQMEKSGPIIMPKKPPRRKYRRRPSRLMEEYKRRSSNHTWLETHIWHAKRFHMTVQYGFHLPERSCARSHRFCHRSVTQHCILMDISYLCCTQLTGTQSDILAGLARLCNPKVGLTFAAVAYLKGTMEGRVLVYSTNGSASPIGLVTYLWRPQEEGLGNRTLWIWSHPAFYEDLLNELLQTFNPLPVEILSLKGQLNRFRLRGPEAYKVVGALLTEPSDAALLGPHLMASYVTGVQVRDPRAIVPQSRVKQENNNPPESSKGAVGSSQSPLWNANVREEFRQLRETISDLEINKRRSQLLVPGSVLPVQPDERPIPLIIINSPREGDGSVSGCDVILPAGWATAFWLALIYSGGHAGGLNDAASMRYEHGICRDLALEVDSSAGRLAAIQRRDHLVELYFRRPPKTRTNYVKLATPYPFYIDWDRLVSYWSGSECHNVSVLRDRELLRSLSSSSASGTVLAPGLLAVTVRLLRGCPQEFSMICWPTSSDIENKSVINEPIHKDPAAETRKALRKQHKLDLARLAKKRKESRDPKKKNEELDPSTDSEPLIAVFKKKMRSLWMPAPPNDFKTDFARPLAGFVLKGDFALSEGSGMGRGFIASNALPSITLKWPLKVLVRNPGTDLYMWGVLELD